ncbi:MAG TPA: choice-of-anchor Q domain-containing protein, partial [Blastocatellia bacterium]|nr:choice-of-anchor Q domain-containing protein [Blastocatellia bacterium]
MKPAQINLKIVVLSLMAFMLGAGPLVPLTTARDGRANPAGSFIVSNLNDSGTGSLRQTIADATPGSTINFAPGLSGTITLTGGELLIDKDLTIIGPGASVLTVSGNNTTRVFNIQGRNVSISGLTIANGNAGNDSGGGILNDSGRLLMFGSYIVNNKALNGAGIAIVNSGSADIFATGIMLNNASGDGGGIKLGNSNPNLVRIDSSTISNNTAGGDGGGIYSHAGAGPLLAGNTTISSNMATNGAGVYSQSTTTALFFSGVTNNTATNNGGGVLLPAVSVANLNSTYIAVNNAPSSGPDVSGDFLADYSLIGNGSGGNITGSNNHIGTSVDPINPMITPLQDNGGRTWTHSPIEGSPMIGAADPNIGLPIDQRNGDRDSTPDIGPVEFKIRNPASLEIISINPTADPSFIDATIRLTEASTGLPISFRDISFAFIRTFGDVDGDGALKPTDPAGFATGTLKIFGTPVPSGIYADFDGDGNYDSSDLSV